MKNLIQIVWILTLTLFTATPPALGSTPLSSIEPQCDQAVLNAQARYIQLNEEKKSNHEINQLQKDIKYWRNVAKNGKSGEEAKRSLWTLELQSMLDMDRTYDVYKNYRPLFYDVKLAYNIALQELDLLETFAGNLDLELDLENNLKILTFNIDEYESVQSMMLKYQTNGITPPSGLSRTEKEKYQQRGKRAADALQLLSQKNLMKEFLGITDDASFDRQILKLDPTAKEVKEFLKRFPKTARWKLMANLREERKRGLLRMVPRASVAKALRLVITKTPGLGQVPWVREDLYAILLEFDDRFSYTVYFPSIVEIATSEISDVLKAKKLDLLNANSDNNEFMISFFRSVDPEIWQHMKIAAKTQMSGSTVIYDQMIAAEKIGLKMKRLSIYGPPPIIITYLKLAAAASTVGILWYFKNHPLPIKLGIHHSNLPSRNIASEENTLDGLFGKDAHGWPTAWDEAKVDQTLDALELAVELKSTLLL